MYALLIWLTNFVCVLLQFVHLSKLVASYWRQENLMDSLVIISNPYDVLFGFHKLKKEVWETLSKFYGGKIVASLWLRN